jgi:hypothetical protein
MKEKTVEGQPRREIWQEILALERELHVVNVERERIIGEIAMRREAITNES